MCDTIGDLDNGTELKGNKTVFLADETGTSNEETMEEMDKTNSLEMFVAQVKQS